MSRILIIIILLYICSSKKNSTIRFILNSTQNDYLPNELYENYMEYNILEEYSNNTCNLENLIENYPKSKTLNKLEDGKCIPDHKTFSLILDKGWTDIGKLLVDNIYLKNNIDPTNTLYNYISKIDSTVKYLEKHETWNEKYDKIKVSYSFENFDNYIKFKVVLPDLSYILEHYSIFCFKDMFKVSAIFRVRNKLYSIDETKYLFDMIENDCEHEYDSFTNTIKVSLNKLHKYKKWEELFKN